MEAIQRQGKQIERLTEDHHRFNERLMAQHHQHVNLMGLSLAAQCDQIKTEMGQTHTAFGAVGSDYPPPPIPAAQYILDQEG